MGDFFKKVGRFLLVSAVAGVIMLLVFKFLLGTSLTLMQAGIGGVAANVFISGSNWALAKAFGENQPFAIVTAAPKDAPPVPESQSGANNAPAGQQATIGTQGTTANG